MSKKEILINNKSLNFTKYLFFFFKKIYIVLRKNYSVVNFDLIFLQFFFNFYV